MLNLTIQNIFFVSLYRDMIRFDCLFKIYDSKVVKLHKLFCKDCFHNRNFYDIIYLFNYVNKSTVKISKYLYYAKSLEGRNAS